MDGIDQRIIRCVTNYILMLFKRYVNEGMILNTDQLTKMAKPENTRNNAIMMYILNPRLKKFVPSLCEKSDIWGGRRVYTTETFLYCWADWLMHCYFSIDVPMDFQTLTVLGP
jgi:hypothetical protein